MVSDDDIREGSDDDDKGAASSSLSTTTLWACVCVWCVGGEGGESPRHSTLTVITLD